MGLKTLAEGIILQSLEDLWDEGLSGGSIAFFRGEGFHICADLAGMDLAGRLKLLGIVKDVVEKQGIARSDKSGSIRVPAPRPWKERTSQC